MGNLVYFSADDGTHGRELWASDGTSDGTRMVSDINLANDQGGGQSGGSWPSLISDLGDGRAVFWADDGQGGHQLWVSDGTANGTEKIMAWDGANIGGWSSFGQVRPGVAVFRVLNNDDAPEEGSALWVTDGTAAGTRMINDAFVGNPWPAFHSFASPEPGKVAFFADDGVHGVELWVTDGTPSGTRLAADTISGAVSGITHGGIFSVADGKLIFAAASDTTGSAIWVTDGTAAGTTQLQSFDHNGLSPSVGISDQPDGRVSIGVDFFDPDPTADPVSYRLLTDGTVAGTVQTLGAAKLFTQEANLTLPTWTASPGGYGLFQAQGPYCQLGDGRVVFGGRTIALNPDGTPRFSDTQQLWVSDGTQAGTIPLVDPFDASLNPLYLRATDEFSFVRLPDGRLLFPGADAGGGDPQLWITDGTPAGTSLFDASIRSISPYLIWHLNEDRLLFKATLVDGSESVLVSDGTREGTVEVAHHSDDIRYSPWISTPDGRVLFQARNASGDLELWITDGTGDGSRVLLSEFSTNLYAGAWLSPDRLIFELPPDPGTILGEPGVLDISTGQVSLLRDVNPVPLEQSAPDHLTSVAAPLPGVSYQLAGEESYDDAGAGFARIGDFDGDGAADLLIAARNAFDDAGAVYLVGFSTLPTADLADGQGDLQVALSTLHGHPGNYTLHGSSEIIEIGWSVAGAGDLNGDGVPDFLLGTPRSDVPLGGPWGTTDGGMVFVVSGADLPGMDQADGTEDGLVDLANLSSEAGSYQFYGNADYAWLGSDLSAPGNIAGSNAPELIMNASNTDIAGFLDGVAYLVSTDSFGTADVADGATDLTIIIDNIIGLPGNYVFGTQDDDSSVHLRPAGDLDGNGTVDLIASETYWDGLATRNKLIFLSSGELGNADAADGISDGLVDIDALPGVINPFVIDGFVSDLHGPMVMDTGADLNGDGRQEILVGHPEEDTISGKTGVAYLFDPAGFSAADLADGLPDGQISLAHMLAQPGSFRFAGVDAFDRTGSDVAFVGDTDGDGRSDILIGARNAPDGEVGGRSYLISSGDLDTLDAQDGAQDGEIDLGRVPEGANSYVFEGATSDATSGSAFAAFGDLDGDGLAEFAIGAPQDAGYAGAVYILSPRDFASADDNGDGNGLDRRIDLGAIHRDQVVQGTSSDDLLNWSYLGDPGLDRIDNSDALDESNDDVINGLGGDDEIWGGLGDDMLLGGAGDDSIAGGPGADTVSGGSGVDTFLVHPGDQSLDILDFELGVDTLDLSAFARGDALSAYFGATAGSAVLTFADGTEVSVAGTGVGPDTLLPENIILGGENFLPTGAIALSGVAEEGGSIEVMISGLSDPEGIAPQSMTFGWKRDGVDIPGADQQSYSPTQADVGARLSVTVSYTDLFGSDERVTSAETAPVVASEPPVNRVGTDGNDLLSGGASNDTLSGLAGADTLEGAGGDDLLDGGVGLDTALFSGDQSSYSIQISPTGTTITDRKTGGNGTDSLISIEFLDFGTEIDLFGSNPMPLTIFDGPATLTAAEFSEIIELYIAYFNRAPDALGLFYWATEYANGFTLPMMAKNFFLQPETRATYASVLDENYNLDLTDPAKVGAFVTEVYANVLGRSPDGPGFDYWTNELITKDYITPDIFILSIIGGAKYPSNPTEQTAIDQAYLATKSDIGAYFAVIKGMSDLDDASASMALFDGSTGSTTTTIAAIDNHYSEALDPDTGDFLMSLVGVIDDPFAG